MKHNLTLKCLCALLVAALLAMPAFAQNADGQSQHEIDSILSLIKPDSPDSVKAKYYSMIGALPGNPDTAIKYANLSLDYCRKTDTVFILRNNNFLYISHFQKGEIKESIPHILNVISIYQAQIPKESKNLSSCFYVLSTIYGLLNNTDSATYYIKQCMELGTQLRDTAMISKSYKSMGELLANKKFYKESKSYFLKAIELDSLTKNMIDYSLGYIRLGEVAVESNKDYYRAKKLISKAINTLEPIDTKNLLYNEKYNHNSYLSYAYCKISDIYIKLAYLENNKTYADSCRYYHKKGSSQNLSNYLSYNYTSVEYLIFYHRNREALNLLTEIKPTIEEKGAQNDKRQFYEFLKEVYTQLGDYRKALDASEKAHEYALALYTDSTMNTLAEMKTEQAMMVERMDRENAEKLHAAEKRQMRIVIFSLIGGMVSVLAVIVLVLRVLSVRKRANNVLAEQKKEIETQRDHIEAQNKEIQASINYARRIQRALLTPDEAIASVFNDYFLLYKPRNVVSGDFYWVGQFGDNKVCIVADCTGHGVPGGFMSVLGMTNLNYIVGQDIAPEAILNKLRDAIMWNLRQNEGNPEELTAQVLDGMDVAAYVVNEKQMTLSFAGANNPLVLIRDGEVQVIKPDKMPVGISVVMKPFQSVTMELRKGDCLYTYSDGFQDQFNIESEKKFQKSRLRDLLLEIHTRPMDEQRELLNLVFKEWRGPAENQTDDVVIMGVRI